MPNLVAKAEGLTEDLWRPLRRPTEYDVQTEPRRPENVKARIVQARRYKDLRLESEHVTTFDYRPTKSHKTFRVLVVRKNLSVERGEQVVFDEIRYFFCITNGRRA